MKHFIFSYFLSHLAALVRQLLLPTLILLATATVSFGQNNFINPQYVKAKIDITRLAGLEEKAGYW
ncbi:MAG: hypothetical protein U0Y68_11990 [Blastocatellia bacterium]